MERVWSWLRELVNKVLCIVLCNFKFAQSFFFYKSVPEAASFYNTTLGDVCEVYISGRRTVLVSDPDVATQVFASMTYRSRFGDAEGLRVLGMRDMGVIWNQDHQRWLVQRKMFEKSVNAKALDKAELIAEDITQSHINKFLESPTPVVDMMKFLRLVTLGITLELMLGVSSSECDANELVDSIVEYFKAWEFFLLRPVWLQMLLFWRGLEHRKAIRRVNKAVAELVQIKMRKLEQGGSQDDFFFEQLMHLKTSGEPLSSAEIQQSVLEMLIAGTDTSSVSMFYTLLLLAEHQQIQHEIVREELIPLQPEKFRKLPLLKAALSESMRVKPVGPVSLRRALCSHTLSYKGREIHISEGDNVIVNIAHMHMREDIFEGARRFDPHRFVRNSELGEQFMPFGKGPKGCVGQFLAWREMQVVVGMLLRNFSFHVVENHTLNNTETRWDIAQQPTSQVPMLIKPRISKGILLIGPSSTGKTTLATALQQELKLPMLTETAREIMKQLNINRDDIRNDKHKCYTLQEQILIKQNDREAAMTETFVSDRSIIDPIIYTQTHVGDDKVLQLEELDAFKAALSRYTAKKPVEAPYASSASETLIFLLQPHAQCIKDDGVRICDTLEKSIENYKLYANYLNKWRIPYTEIDVLNMRDRVDIVLRRVYQTAEDVRNP